MSQLEISMTNITEVVDEIMEKSHWGGVEIGGRNLLRYTETPTNVENYLIIAGNIVAEKYKGLSVLHRVQTEQINIMQYAKAIDVDYGSTYVLSFYAKGTGKIKVFLYGNNTIPVVKTVGSNGENNTAADGNMEFELTPDWKRYWVKWQISTTTITNPVAKNVLISGLANSEVYLCGAMLEEAKINSNWVPAQEDKQDKITNFGGKNIALNTRTFFDTPSGKYENTQLLNIENVIDNSVPSGVAIKISLGSFTGTDRTGVYYTYGKIIGDLNKLKKNNVYTISFYIKASKNTTLKSLNAITENQTFIKYSTGENITPNVTSEWQRFWVTFKYTNTTKFTSAFYVADGDLDLYLSSYKLEEGKIDTDWTPAPEDKLNITGGTVTGQLQLQKGYIVHKNTGMDMQGYLILATITIKKSYSDYPIAIEFMQRSKTSFFTVYVSFSLEGNNDPDVREALYIGTTNDIYLYKLSAGKHQILVKKNGIYDVIAVTSVKYFGDDNFDISWGDTQIASLPDGVIKAKKIVSEE